MKKLLIVLCFFSGLSLITHAQQPLSFQPAIWLEAGNAVSNTDTLFDLSGNDHHALFTSQTNPLSQELFNFNPALGFNGCGQEFSVNYPLKKNQKLCVYIVYQSGDSLSESGLWSVRTDSFNTSGLGTKAIYDFKDTISYDSLTSTKPIINCLDLSWKRIEIDTSVYKLTIGKAGSMYFNGKIAEFILFDKKVNKKDNREILSYLALKYGITLKRTGYYQSDNKELFSFDDHQEWFYDVAGIGRDDGTGLNQKQSAGNGGETELVIAAGSLATSNNNNAFQPDNLNFLIWGHNGKGLNVDQDTSDSNKLHYLLNRKWIMKPTGDSANTWPTQVVFDISKLDFPNPNIMLVISPGDNEFLLQNANTIFPDSISAFGQVFFSNINWDTDKSGEDYFSFILPQGNQPNKRFANPASLNGLSGDCNFAVKVYPNPNTGWHEVEIKADEQSGFSISYYSLDGRIILTDECQGSDRYLLEYNLAEQGTYLLVIRNRKVTKSHKVIVK